MRVLIALLLSAAPVVAQDSPWVFDDPFVWSISEKGGDRSTGGTDVTSSSVGQVSETPALESFVHRINVVNRGGSATCIAPGVYITCKHLFEGLRGFQVSIDGQAVAASVTMAPSHDVAIVRLGSEAAAASDDYVKFDVVTPYMAECQAFGFGSETVHKGVISNDDTLSLYLGEGTIEQGDSGGAVFCDGVLVGVIRGKNPANGLVCYFTPLSSVASMLPSPGAAVAPPTETAAAPSLKPKLTIVSPATWDCQHCPGHRDQDWSDFDVEFIKSDDRELFPCTEWTDKRGVTRRLYGLRKPSAVMWSYRETMK